MRTSRAIALFLAVLISTNDQAAPPDMTSYDVARPESYTLRKIGRASPVTPHSSIPRPLRSSKIGSTKPSTALNLKVELTSCTSLSTVYTSALLDSGATGLIIDKRFRVKERKLRDG